MDEYTPNQQAYSNLINDINHLFIGLEYDEPCDICDGDMKLLDKAVKKFKPVSYTHLTLPTIYSV